MNKVLKLHIPNKHDIEHFEVVFNNLTHEVYFDQFGRDFFIEVVESFSVEGFFTRALAHRVVWAMAKTKDENFISFRDFLTILDDSIIEYETQWGLELWKYLEPHLLAMVGEGNENS